MMMRVYDDAGKSGVSRPRLEWCQSSSADTKLVRFRQPRTADGTLQGRLTARYKDGSVSRGRLTAH